MLRLDETPDRRVTRAHLATVAWRGAYAKSSLVAQVSLFNATVYEITFCEELPSGELWQPIASGHQFDWEQRRIRPLTAINMNFARALEL